MGLGTETAVHNSQAPASSELQIKLEAAKRRIVGKGKITARKFLVAVFYTYCVLPCGILLFVGFVDLLFSSALIYGIAGPVVLISPVFAICVLAYRLLIRNAVKEIPNDLPTRDMASAIPSSEFAALIRSLLHDQQLDKARYEGLTTLQRKGQKSPKYQTETEMIISGCVGELLHIKGIVRDVSSTPLSVKVHLRLLDDQLLGPSLAEVTFSAKWKRALIAIQRETRVDLLVRLIALHSVSSSYTDGRILKATEDGLKWVDDVHYYGDEFWEMSGVSIARSPVA